MKTIITKMSIIGLIVLMMASCKKDPEMPSGEFVNIKTNEVTDVTAVSAVVSAYVGAGCDERGVCWSTSPNPTISGSHTTNGSGTGSFTSNITGLTENTKYYVRAYATDSKGTSYGAERNFTTKDGITVVTTSFVTNIMAATATCGGNVTDDGGLPVTARGVCWSTSQNPTVAGNHTTDGGGTGTFTSELTGLAENTTYYVRAYATNSYGTGYGEAMSFKTLYLNDEYVDLGLPSGLLWATCNVGADSPDDYGWYLMWGSVTEGGDPDCSWANCPGNGGSSDYNSSAIAAWNATHLTNGVLNPDVDAAHVNWGGDWRMPTRAEWQELNNNTNSTWTTENGKFGRKFASKTDAAKYIFLPAAGSRSGTHVSVVGSYGFYWSSSLYSSYPFSAYDMYFVSGNVYPQDGSSRYYGYCVRPVRAAR